MKKNVNFLPLYIIMVCCFTVMSGCTGKTYEGKALVDNAKSLHTALEAAHITVTDCSDSGTEIVVQEIWYRFAGDIMQYMYIGRDADTGEEYYEFNNGTELDTWHTGDEKWAFAARGSEGFYNYSRAGRHYFADGEKLLEDYPDAVKEADVTGGENSGLPEGEKQIDVGYYPDMGKYYTSMDGVTDYDAVYTVDSDGYCIKHRMSYTKDGRKYVYALEIERTDDKAPINRVEPEALE